MTHITPHNVHATLGKYMLADGFELVFDLEKSQGSYFYDLRTGRKYLDFFSFFASSPVGFNHPKLTTPEMIQKLGRLAVNNITNSDLYTVEMAEFVDTFHRSAVPPYMKYSFYVAGGALGVENAIKAAMDWKVRKNLAKGYRREIGNKVIHFEEAFHGRTGYTMSMTNTADPNKYKYFAKFDWPRIISPKVKFPLTEGNLEDVENREKIAIAQIKTAFLDNRDEVCAIIIEPIQGEGGDNHFRPEFMKELRRLCNENDAMFIVDEVQAGVGLTGKWWSHQHADVQPDMLAFGKKSQVCGFLCGPRIDDIPDNCFHVGSRLNSTWGGNLIDMYRFKLYLEIIQEEKLLENATKTGDLLHNGLQRLEEEFPHLISNVRGKGLMCAFDLPTPAVRDHMRRDFYEAGVVLLPCGIRSVRFRPPLTISPSEVQEGLSIFQKSLARMTKEVEWQPVA
ncbi:L-lysine 6-transaminase [candidate division KSB1 bacterium]|nr:L-lysine 6-transaminase [candidate division KSB1 bacterium]